MQDFLDVLKLVIEESSVMLALRGRILVPAQANELRLRRFVNLSVALKDCIALVLGHNNVGSRTIACSPELFHLSRTFVISVSLGLLGTLLLSSEQLLLQVSVELLEVGALLGQLRGPASASTSRAVTSVTT
jgi:hypothetical protein